VTIPPTRAVAAQNILQTTSDYRDHLHVQSRSMRQTRFAIASLVALCGLLLVGTVILGIEPALLANDASNAILWVSIGILLFAFAGAVAFK
jgi:hypothetical protein